MMNSKKKLLCKRRKHSKSFFLVIMLVMIVTISFVLILKIENRISDRISDFCEVEMNKITKNIILEAVNSSLDLDNTDSNLLVIDKNSNG